MKNYCKNTTFDVIKTRSKIICHNFYFVINEIVKKLNNIFKIYNKVVKLNVDFHNLNFAISVKNKKKSFKIFYIRFSAAIIFLNYKNVLKMFNLKQLINIRLRYRIFNEFFFFISKHNRSFTLCRYWFKSY